MLPHYLMPSLLFACRIEIPKMKIVFSGELSPWRIDTHVLFTPNADARHAQTALLALPFSGDADTFTFTLSPNCPTISVLDAFGMIFTNKTMPVSVASIKSITEHFFIPQVMVIMLRKSMCFISNCLHKFQPFVIST